MNKDYYDILGVEPESSVEDIKRAYRILAQQFHPDKDNGSEKRFKEINEAYRVLSNDKSRQEYDFDRNRAGHYKKSESNQSAAHSEGEAISARKKYLYAVCCIFFLVIIINFIGNSNNKIATENTPVPSVVASTTYTKSLNTSNFPFWNSSAQYSWYDEHNVPMSNRCYTTMNPPCSDTEWQQATGVTPPSGSLSPISKPNSDTNENTLPVSISRDNFYVSVPTGNSSSCTWTWAEGGAQIPYSQTTSAVAGQQNILTIPSGERFNFSNLKVNCTDDFGGQYVGVLPK